MATVTAIPMICNLAVRYAHFYGLPGYAVRTAERRVFFIDQDAGLTELTDVDIPELILLGDVALAEVQNLLDTLAGGAVQIACTRQMEVA